MMWTLDYFQLLMSTFMSLVYIHLVYNVFLKPKDWVKSQWPLLVGCLILLFTLNYFMSILDSDIFELVYSFILCFILFEDKLVSKLFAIVCMSAIAYSFEVIFRILQAIILQVEYTDLYVSNFELYSLFLNVFQLTAIIAFYYLYFVTMNHKRIRVDKLSNLSLGVTTFLILFTTAFLYNADNYFVNVRYVITGISSTFIIATILIAIVSIILTVMTIQLRNLKDVEGVKNELLKEMLNSKGKHYLRIEALNKRIRKNNHDVYSQLLAVKLLLENERITEANSYLSKLINKVNNSERVIESGNELFDTIINEKMLFAKKHNIDFKFNGIVPEGEFIDYLHLCTICGNGFDNATEACKKIKDVSKREVIVTSSITNDHWYINIENPMTNDSKLNDTNRKSTKLDSDYHGYGLDNIKEAIIQCDGIINLTSDDGWFRMKIAMKY